MNTTNLKVGKSYKNLKDLCDTLETPHPKGGNNIASKLNMFDRYFEYERIGNWFKITNVFEEPIESCSRYNPHREIIEAVILSMLVQNETKIMNIGRAFLMESLQMINRKFREVNRNVNNYSKSLGIPKEEIEDWHKLSNQQIQYTIEAALKSMERKFLIIWTHCKIIIQNDLSYSAATDSEMEDILMAQCEVLEEMGYPKDVVTATRDLNRDGRYLEFSHKAQAKLHDLYGYHGFFSGYHIVYLKNEKLNSEAVRMIEEAKRLINSGTSEMLLDTAKKRNSRAKESMDILDEKNLMRGSEQYVANCQKLIDTFIKI